eukprot:4175939-Pleurochrysis_carterae.AAC.1
MFERLDQGLHTQTIPGPVRPPPPGGGQPAGVRRHRAAAAPKRSDFPNILTTLPGCGCLHCAPANLWMSET